MAIGLKRSKISNCCEHISFYTYLGKGTNGLTDAQILSRIRVLVCVDITGEGDWVSLLKNPNVGPRCE